MEGRGVVARIGLLARFAVICVLLLAALGVALAAVTARAVERSARGHAEQIALLGGRLGIQPVLTPQDFRDGLDAARLVEVEADIAAALEGQPVRRVKIFDRTGRIVFSDQHDLIGQRFGVGPNLAASLDGRVVSVLDVPEGAEHATERDLGALLEVYTPVTYAGEGTVGAFELYLPYGPIAAQIRDDVRELTLVITAGLALLFLALFRTVAAASARLRRQAAENDWLAHHDPLTGLPSRRGFTERAARLLEEGRGVGVLLIDVDRFREVNDSLGHATGDRLLGAIAERLRAGLDADDVVARLGADEFAVLLCDTDGPLTALVVAERLLAALRRPFPVDEVTLEIDASIGVVAAPDHGRDPETLLRRADLALQAARAEHRGATVHRPELDGHTRYQLALFGDLRRAIADDELVLHYQPKVELADWRVSGVEALVRWEHPEHGALPPDVFVPLAEHTGLIKPLTAWVLDAALAQCRRWREVGMDLSVAVNLSARDLLDVELPNDVARLLAHHGLPTTALELEITETSMVLDPQRALEILSQLQEQGLHLAVDDFGTGYSSLQYLRRLPVSTLKIDRTFVQGIDREPADLAIVRSTIELARALDLRVVAEGVERPEVLEKLVELGCDAVQGFLLARPAPADEVPALVARLQPTRSTA